MKNERDRPLRPRPQLKEARLRAFPKTTIAAFAGKIGLTEKDVISVEVGRRDPSLAIVIKWLAVLGPDATLALFRPLPHFDDYLVRLAELQRLDPQALKVPSPQIAAA